MKANFKAEIKDGKLIIHTWSEEREYIGKDGKVHKDVVIHAPSLKMIAKFKEEINGKRNLPKNESKPDEQDS